MSKIKIKKFKFNLSGLVNIIDYAPAFAFSVLMGYVLLSMGHIFSKYNIFGALLINFIICLVSLLILPAFCKAVKNGVYDGLEKAVGISILIMMFLCVHIGVLMPLCASFFGIYAILFNDVGFLNAIVGFAFCLSIISLSIFYYIKIWKYTINEIPEGDGNIITKKYWETLFLEN